MKLEALRARVGYSTGGQEYLFIVADVTAGGDTPASIKLNDHARYLLKLHIDQDVALHGVKPTTLMGSSMTN